MGDYIHEKSSGQAVTHQPPLESEVFQAVVSELLESFSDAFPLDGIRLHESQARLIAAGICGRLFFASAVPLKGCGMAKTPKSEDEKREDDVLKRMLSTPPKPHKPPTKKRGPKPAPKGKGQPS